MPSSHLILCHPLLLLSPIPPSIRVFSNESTLHIRWPKYWSFSFSMSPSNEHPGLIFRMDWLDLLAVQGTLKSLLQHYRCTLNLPTSFPVHSCPSLTFTATMGYYLTSLLTLFHCRIFSSNNIRPIMQIPLLHANLTLAQLTSATVLPRCCYYCE